MEDGEKPLTWLPTFDLEQEFITQTLSANSIRGFGKVVEVGDRFTYSPPIISAPIGCYPDPQGSQPPVYVWMFMFKELVYIFLHLSADLTNIEEIYLRLFRAGGCHNAAEI